MPQDHITACPEPLHPFQEEPGCLLRIRKLRAFKRFLLCRQLPTAGAAVPTGVGRAPFQGSGDGHSTGDLAVALPVGPLAGQEGITWRRLLVAVDVERS